MKAKDPSQTPEKKTKVDDEKLIILCSGWEVCMSGNGSLNTMSQVESVRKQ